MADPHEIYKISKKPSNDHSSQAWYQLANWFQRERLKCVKSIYNDDTRQVITKADMAYSQLS